MSGARALCLAWGAVVALLAYPAGAQVIGQEGGILGGEAGFLRPSSVAATDGTITVTNSTGSTITGASIEFTIDTATLITAGDMAADCGVIITAGAAVPHWLEGGCDTASTTYWFHASSLPVGDTVFLLSFGGSPSYQKESVFPFFDDFDGGSLDAQWTASTGTPTVSGGAVSLGNVDGIFAGGDPIPFDYIIESSAAVTGAALGTPLRISTNTTTGWVGDGGAGIVGMLIYVGQLYLETSTAETAGVFVNQTGVEKEYRIEYRPDSTADIVAKYDGGNTISGTDASTTSTLHPVLYNASATTIDVHWIRAYKDVATSVVVSIAP